MTGGLDDKKKLTFETKKKCARTSKVGKRGFVDRIPSLSLLLDGAGERV